MKTPLLATLVALLIAASSCKTSTSTSGTELFPVSTDHKYGFIDRTGKWVINPQFAQVSAFRDGLAMASSVGNEERFGFIDKTGKYVVAPVYVSATVFSDGLAFVVAENKAPVAIDTKGNIKFTLDKAETVHYFSDSLAAFSVAEPGKEEKWGFVDITGDVKIQPMFSATGDFTEGLCAVVNDRGKCGYIDKKGTLVINYQFDLAQPFMYGVAPVCMGKLWGVIDTKGSFIINPQFENVYIDGDIFLATKSDKWGWIDKTGKTIIDFQFDEACPFFTNDMASVKTGKKWGYINRKGAIAINPQFNWVITFDAANAIVANDNGKVGLIDKEGKYTVNPQFGYVAPDYFYMMESSTNNFRTVSSDITSPEKTAGKWLDALLNITGPKDMELLRKLSDRSLDHFLDIIEGIKQYAIKNNTRREPVAIKLLNIKANDSMAVIHYVGSNDPNNIQPLVLKKENGIWVVFNVSEVD